MKKGQKKTMSAKQIEANRNNGHKSKGPTTPNGKARSSQNAITHGILSKQVVVKGFWIRESTRDLQNLRERLWQDCAPVGAQEEMLVDEIVTIYWRLRRALAAESGEVALSVDNGWWRRLYPAIPARWMTWSGLTDPVHELHQSLSGVWFLVQVMAGALLRLNKDGELTEEHIQCVSKKFHDIPNVVTEKMKEFRTTLLQNPEGLEAGALKAKHLQVVGEYLKQKFADYLQLASASENREKKLEQAHQAANHLPSGDTLDKILRYETTLKRHLYRAMTQLERLQRRRLGEHVPPPLTMEVSGRN